MDYKNPFWLPNGHLQTIYPAIFIPKPTVAFRRERWETPDGDFIDVDFIDGKPGLPFVLMFHGLEGSSDSHYSRALMADVAARGWSGAVAHFRGCSGEHNVAPRFYHSADAAEVDWILRRLRPRFSGKFYATGVSLGGNVLLRWLGESQHAAEKIVDAACAVSAPLDLARGGAAISSGFNRVYTMMFLQTLKPKCLAKLEQFPGLFDRQAMLAARNMHDFDDAVTAPLHGFDSADDYWDRGSAKHILGDITVPTLVLNAQNDPFLPGIYLPRRASPSVVLDYPQHGGHVGFAAGRLPGSLEWLPQRLIHFLEGGRTSAAPRDDNLRHAVGV
jgi:predicted alpha/beta-fold hydrolase